MNHLRTTTWILDFESWGQLPVSVELPPGNITAHDLLPAVFTLTDAIVEQTCATLQTNKTPVTCGPGCGVCCHQLVPISEYEAVHLANVLRSMESVQRKKVINRFNKAINLLEKAELMSDITHTFAHDAHTPSHMLEIKKRYWDARIPCPFLEEGACSIHPIRPVACRQYLVTSSPEHCASLYCGHKRQEEVRLPLDAGGAMASFSGEGLQHTRVLPLIFSLLAERSIRARPFPTLPGERMMGRFLDLMTSHFSNTR